VGGGVTHAPKPRSYEQKTPKKMVRNALRSALSDRASDGKIIVIDSWGIDEPSTKAASAALVSLGLESTKRVLVVLGEDDANVWKSFRNLGKQVHLLLARELNAYDVLVSDIVVFTTETLPSATKAGEPVDDGTTPVMISRTDPSAETEDTIETEEDGAES
jgi:large subunit ribosomal protein L4